MKKSTLLAVLLVAAAGLPGCGKKPAPQPPPPPVAPPTPAPAPTPVPTPKPVAVEDDYTKFSKMSVDELDRLKLFESVHFDYDKFDLREADRKVLAQNAEKLKKFDFIKVKVEGHCDERGTAEYNTALGEKRAKAAYDYLVSLGVPAARLSAVSYGKEIPLCTESTESCWAQNRRGQFSVSGKTK